MSYKYSYEYFAFPSEAGAALKSHIMRPHTDVPMCGQELGDSHKLAYDLPKGRSLCALCLDRLRAYLESRGKDAVSLHVFKALVRRLQSLEAPD